MSAVVAAHLPAAIRFFFSNKYIVKNSINLMGKISIEKYLLLTFIDNNYCCLKIFFFSNLNFFHKERSMSLFSTVNVRTVLSNAKNLPRPPMAISDCKKIRHDRNVKKLNMLLAQFY